MSFYVHKLEQSGAILAPMAGYSDAPFRQLARRYGALWAVSEMMSAQGVLASTPKNPTLAIGMPYPNEPDLVLQLFGADPELLAAASAKVTDLYQPQAIDLNMGCPVPKMRGRGGACLLQTPEVAAAIVSAMVAATPLPISVKMRLGWEHNQALDIALALQEAGAALITIHGRTQAQKYTGEADWAAVGAVAQQLSIPVIGSGDVRNASDAQRFKSYGVAGVMIGRGAVGQPWIFQQIHEEIDPEPDPNSPSLNSPSVSDRFNLAYLHAQLNAQWYGERKGLLQLRKVLAAYLPEWRTEVLQVARLQDLEHLAERLHLQLQPNSR